MNIYTQNIIDHYKNPDNFGKPPTFTSTAKITNLSCGDEVEVFLNIVDGKIKKINFLGSGCSISIATMSMLTTDLIGRQTSEISNLTKAYLENLIGIEISTRSREKCLLIGLEAIQKAITQPPTHST